MMTNAHEAAQQRACGRPQSRTHGTKPAPAVDPHLLIVGSAAGNAAVCRLVAAVQRQRVAVSGGSFNDNGPEHYKVHVGSPGKWVTRGAEMGQLVFTPKVELLGKDGARAKEVSLVQTTNSTIKDEMNPEAADQRGSLLDKRWTEGWTAIDQEIYIKDISVFGHQKWLSARMHAALQDLATLVATSTSVIGVGKSGSKGVLSTVRTYVDAFAPGGEWGDDQIVKSAVVAGLVETLEAVADAENRPEVAECVDRVRQIRDLQRTKINLDPRYHEERTTQDEKLKDSPPPRSYREKTTGWAAKRADPSSKWESDAMLRDQPGHTVEAGHQLRGREQFEVAALVDGTIFAGSVRWGWKIDGEKPELEPKAIEKVDHGSASEEFYEAAKAWNAMEVPDLLDPTKRHSPFPLPTTR